jgi:hypothetical protein
MGCGSSFPIVPSIINNNKKSDISNDNSDRLPPIISREKPQKSIRFKEKRSENFEPFTLIWLDDDYDDNDQEFRSIIDYLRCFDDFEKCEEFIQTNNNKYDYLFFIVSNQYATNIISHIHDSTQIISIYILQQNISNDKAKKNVIDQKWTKRYTKVKYLPLRRPLNVFFFR